MEPKKNTDDESTVSIPPQDDIPTEAIAGAAQKPKLSPSGETELDLIHSYWLSGLPALKKQAVSRYAKLSNVSTEKAEAALTEWARLNQAK
ncbi:MAG TPA: hypothetical protein VKE70_08140 [Candidatus Solibacter sp.]|nr:hypothetical protein [Candidatus Solibacter sp.]